MPLILQFLASTCTLVPMRGKPKLKGEEKSCGDVGGRMLTPWLYYLRGGWCGGGSVGHSTLGAPELMCWPFALADVGGEGETAKPLLIRVYSVMAAVQLNIEEEPEMPPSFSSPALSQTLSPPYTRARGTKISLKIPSMTLLPLCCQLLCARLIYAFMESNALSLRMFSALLLRRGKILSHESS